MRICDLESHINRDEKETVRAKEGISEEIKRADSESDTTGIPLKAKETARPSYRRRKLRVTSRDDRSNSLIAEMKPKIAGFTNEQATRVASFNSAMFTLWPPNLSGLSRGVVFDLGML